MSESSGAKAILYTDPKAFLAAGQKFLEQQEIVNGLILGVTMRLAEKPGWDTAAPFLATVEDGEGAVMLAAAITPPHNLLLAGADNFTDSALEALIDQLRAGQWTFPGINAENRLAERFSAAWTRLTGHTAQVRTRLRVYELRKVISPSQHPDGFLRMAQKEDFDLVQRWREAFSYESMHQAPLPDMNRQTAQMIDIGAIYLWDDYGPASIAAWTRPTPHGISVGSVYTPPELRGRGYASTCVAALSQRLLDSGKEFCSLFTDLDYPTSNSIYMKIGYQPVCDYLEYSFA